MSKGQRAKKRLNHSNYETPAKGNGTDHSKSDLTPDSPTMLERVELPVAIDETVRSAVISLIEHDDNIMRKILDIVTKELVLRLTADPQFTEQIAKQITETGIVNEMMKLPSSARRAGNSRRHCCCRAGGLRTQLERQVTEERDRS